MSMRLVAAAPSQATLDAARQIGDDPADALVARLAGRFWAINALLREVRRNQERLPEALPDDVRSFFVDRVVLPPWLNRTRVLNAQHWAERHIFHITVALFCASLPSAYAAERGARVLAATGRMADDLDRRINETARFVLDVLAPGSLDPEGAALPAIAKVRLMHAAIRTRMKGADEVPINQEDLLGTMLGFSVVVVRAVRRLGIQVERAEAEDFYHLWRGIGALLGIKEALLPKDFSTASDTADAIANRQFRASDHGRALMARLLVRAEDHVGVPGLRAAPAFLVRYLLGDRTADILGIAAVSPARASLVFAGSAGGVLRSSVQALALQSAPLVGRRLLDAIVSAKLGTKDVAFSMPIEERLRTAKNGEHSMPG
jgi:hypothetical protein